MTDAVVTTVAGAVSVIDGAVDWWDLMRFFVFVGCAVGHLVGTREPEERRRHADRDGEHVDQTSIWIFSAALVLPVSLLLALLILVRCARYRIARKALHRFMFTSAAIAASALGVHAVSTVTPLYAWVTGARALPRQDIAEIMVAVGSLAAAVAVYFLMQAILVGTARGLITRSWGLAELLGSRTANAFIVTTLLKAVCASVVQSFALPLMVTMVPIVVRSTRREQQLMQERADREKAEARALRDTMTGLHNKEAFNAFARIALMDDQAAGQETALVFVDIDHFKECNNVLGHIGADEVLKAVAEIVRTETRLGDVSGRWGGEEFAIVLRRTRRADALVIAERIRHAAATKPITVQRPAGGATITINTEGQMRCTISAGIAVAPEHGTELADLLELADQALTRAKANGRNRVVIAPPTRDLLSSPSVSPLL